MNLDDMYSNMAELKLMAKDTEHGRKRLEEKFEPYRLRESRDKYRLYNW